ncbi:MAG TPA: hypothetical protein VNM16_13485 [Bacillota bacterium]|nr:hypothetical protein [Bacillota bacterium]
MKVAALVAELFFASKVEVALGQMGCAVSLLAGPDDLPAAQPDLLILDLALAGPAREAAAAFMTAAGRPMIAVGSHVDTASLQWARTAGCAEVLTRGEVDRALATLVAKHLARLPS